MNDQLKIVNQKFKTGQIYENLKKQTIGVVFGSRSPEHDVSIITAQLIISGLLKLGCKVVAIYLDKQGNWWIEDGQGQTLNYRKGLFSIESFRDEQKTFLKNFKPYYLNLEKSRQKLSFKEKGVFNLDNGKDLQVDLVFPALHGINGEDGSLQGMLELFNVRYVGCNLSASTVAMDKILTKLVANSLNIPVSKFIYEYKPSMQTGEQVENFELLEKEKIQSIIERIQTKGLKLPLFVKPPSLGSSIGISKISHTDNWQEELKEAVKLAWYYDQKVLIEEGVPNAKDLTCCVLGYKEQIFSSLVQESKYNQDFFSYTDKYLDEGGAQTGQNQKKIVIPADISEQESEFIQKTSQVLFKDLGCQGIARFDFLLDGQTRKIFLSEINPLPGNLYEHLWKLSGLEFTDLLVNLLVWADIAWQDKQKLTYTFNSNILNVAVSSKGKFSN